MATTRALDETPYFGSTRLANLLDEAQLASTRQVATAAAPRAKRRVETGVDLTEFDSRIPIRPNYRSVGPAALLRQPDLE